MTLVVFSGLPGTGKSVLAEYAAGQLACPVFCKDRLEASLLLSGVPKDRASWAGYDLLTTLAAEQFRLGQSAILDSVAAYERIRVRWQGLAAESGASFRVVECICSDETAHRTRLEARRRNIAGWPELSWDDVLEVRRRYDPWNCNRLVLDAMRPLENNLDALRQYLSD